MNTKGDGASKKHLDFGHEAIQLDDLASEDQLDILLGLRFGTGVHAGNSLFSEVLQLGREGVLDLLCFPCQVMPYAMRYGSIALSKVTSGD